MMRLQRTSLLVGWLAGLVDEFLDREQECYHQQLERYASIMSKMEESPIRLGL